MAGVRRWLRPSRSSSRTSGTSPTSRSSRCWSPPGDAVAAEDPLVTLESDKATMDVPVAVRRQGRRAERVASATRSPRASLLLTLSAVERRAAAAAGGAPTAPRPRPAPAAHGVEDAVQAEAAGRRRAGAAAPAVAPALAAGRRRRRRRTRSPAVRRLARELGVDLSHGHGHRPQGPDHQGGRAGGAKAPAAAPARPRRPARRSRASTSRRGRRSTSRSSARSSAVPLTRIQKISRPEPGPQLGDDPARHPPRRGGHHRARGVPQAHERGARQAGRQGDDGRAAGEGRRRRR